ncbi:MAG: hypothetical protein ABIS68_11425 [Casimicrobiaceae bacterium]
MGDSDGAGADGIVFVVQPVSSTVGGGGGGIGYFGIPTSLAVTNAISAFGASSYPG